jgi:hypothetical protein
MISSPSRIIVLALPLFFAGCVAIPRGLDTKTEDFGTRRGGNGQVLEKILQETVKEKVFLLFSPEGGDLNYTWTTYYKYYLIGREPKPIELPFLTRGYGAHKLIWVRPVSGTPLWVAFEQSYDATPPPHFLSYQITVFDADHRVYERNIDVYNRLVSTYQGIEFRQTEADLDSTGHYLKFGTPNGYDTFGVLEGKVLYSVPATSTAPTGFGATQEAPHSTP